MYYFHKVLELNACRVGETSCVSMQYTVGETSRSRFARSAGDRQPRVLDCADDGEGQALALR